jgi:hypothetical protein
MGDKLRASGIADTAALLAKTSKPKDREALAAITGISGKLILKFANRADLMRVNGVGEEYADLLEAAGVDTVPELAQRKAQNLFDALAQTNAEEKAGASDTVTQRREKLDSSGEGHAARTSILSDCRIQPKGTICHI